MRVMLLCLLITLFRIPIFCQVKSSNADKTGFKPSIYAGLSYQKFMLQQWFVPSSNTLIPFLGAEQNPEGFGLSIPIEFYSSNRNLGILVNPILRYDVVRPYVFSINGVPKDKYSLFSDYHFSIFRKFRIRRIFSNPLKAGIGYSFISPFIAFDEDNPQLLQRMEVKLDFEGFHFFLNLPFTNEISLKQQFMYVPHGQIMYNGFWEAMMYNISIQYKIY